MFLKGPPRSLELHAGELRQLSDQARDVGAALLARQHILPALDHLLAGTPYAVLCACAAGYRADDDKYASAPKVRHPAAELIKRI